MLQRWLGQVHLEEFRSRYLQQQPLATPGGGMDVRHACDWQELGHLLEAASSDVLVVAASQLLAVPAPRTLAELRALFRAGAGVALRNPAPCGPGLLEISRALARDVPGDQRVIVFATPKATHGFGWHYDAEDVFIVQTAGDKEYFFRANTVDPEPVRGGQPDFSLIRRERTPVMSCRLVAGDFLYLPRGFWHVAYAHEDSLSLSIGVFASRPNLDRGEA